MSSFRSMVHSVGFRTVLLVVLGSSSAISGCEWPDPPSPISISSLGGGGAEEGGGGTGGAGSQTEKNCTNGVDDDGDGKTDCDDEDCQSAYSRAPAAEGVDVEAWLLLTATCEAGFQPESLRDCAACACEATPGTCVFAGGFYGNETCTGANGGLLDGFVTVPDVTCSNVTDVPSSSHIRVNSIAPGTPGMCTLPSAEEPSVTACRAPMGSGPICAPKELPVCVLLRDVVECPATGYSEKHALADAANGSCGCSCGAPVNECDTHMTVYDVDGCESANMTPGKPVEITPGTCLALDSTTLPAIIKSVGAPAARVTCDATATPTGPVRTMCCQPSAAPASP